MKNIIVENKKIKKEVITCDRCGKEQTGYTYSWVKKCKICEGDVCFNCSVHLDYDSILNRDIPSFNSDHPDYICRECWNKGKEIREKIDRVRDKADEDEQSLWEEWRKIK